MKNVTLIFSFFIPTSLAFEDSEQYVTEPYFSTCSGLFYKIINTSLRINRKTLGMVLYHIFIHSALLSLS